MHFMELIYYSHKGKNLRNFKQLDIFYTFYRKPIELAA